MKIALVYFVAASVGAAAPETLGASSAYPVKPVRLIVAGTPGSPPDALTRIVAEPLGAALGQPVLVENRPGGTGTIAMSTVAKATPDGHTLGTIGLTHMVAPGLVAQMPYDTLKDLAPVSTLAWTGNLLVVRAASPLESITDFVAQAKARPGSLTYASAGNGTPSHLVSELFKRHARIEVVHIPHKGIGPGLVALLGGQIDIAFSGVATAVPHITSGKLRALATSAPRRLPAYPKLATAAELGFSGFQVDEWMGVVAPAGTPPDITAKLARELARAMSMPETRTRLAAIGFYPTEQMGPASLESRIRAELPRWTQLVREAGIRAD